jgi:alkylated DNA repair dioxygenase AlkB
MAENHVDLFGIGSTRPAGLRYLPDLLDEREEQQLAQRIAEQNLAPFEFHGFLGKRRVISFGHRYQFGDGGGLKKGDEVPSFLLPIRNKVTSAFDLDPAKLVQVLLTEYAAGAAIGWHKDRSVFGDVIGISLLSPCTFRFRRKAGAKWERQSLNLEPRSAYLLRGPARTEWEHSIPAVTELRYSITFRTLEWPLQQLGGVVLILAKQLGVALGSLGVFASRWFDRDPYQRRCPDDGRGKCDHSRFLGPLGAQLLRSRASPVGPRTDDQSQP